MSRQIETARSFYGWRIVVLHWLGRLLRVHFHVMGEPFGKWPTRIVWTRRGTFTSGYPLGTEESQP